MSLKMNNTWLWSLFCAILLLGSCAESELTLDEEMLSFSEATVLGDDLKVSDLLMDGAPEEFQKAVATMLQNGVGRKLLQQVKAKFVKDIRIQFKPFLDSNGEIVREPAIMKYAGNGVMYYTLAALKHKHSDELLFHEFFHIFQVGELLIKSRNNEVEAYVAQCIYAQSKGTGAPGGVISKYFSELIQILANCIDIQTGYFRADVVRPFIYRH